MLEQGFGLVPAIVAQVEIGEAADNAGIIRGGRQRLLIVLQGRIGVVQDVVALRQGHRHLFGRKFGAGFLQDLLGLRRLVDAGEKLHEGNPRFRRLGT